MLEMFVALICAAAGVGDARVMQCLPVLLPPEPAAICAARIRRAREIEAQQPDVHVEARCVAPGDPA